MRNAVGWYCWSSYDDMGTVMELGAVYDDTLKKDDTFVTYAVMVAQRIAAESDPKAKITWGKWGARIDPLENKHLTTNREIEELAARIYRHPSWTGLALSTWVFTYGEFEECP